MMKMDECNIGTTYYLNLKEIAFSIGGDYLKLFLDFTISLEKIFIV